MEKIAAKSSYIKTFKNHMSFFVTRGVISQDQADAMVSLIEKKSVKFISVVTIIGSILIGLGILLYIASNWDHFNELTKILLIVVAMCGFFIYGVKLDLDYKNTGKALIYIAILIYGGGLFLIDQIFNLNIALEHHFLFWLVGLIPMIYLLKDFLIYLFVECLAIAYVFIALTERWSYSSTNTYVAFAIMALLLIVLAKINEDQFKAKLSAFINHIFIIFVLLYLSDVINLNPLFQVLLILVFGCYVLYTPLLAKFAGVINTIQGTIIIGVTGLILTYENIWEEFSVINDGTWFAIYFGIFFAIYLLYLTKKGSLVSLVFICMLILRYYTDTFYDFLPKSIFFIVGGLILLGFGFYLERLARSKGGRIDVKKDR